ncbi:MAG: hypothetical protein Q9175_006236 [Cornicularia normoerica]
MGLKYLWRRPLQWTQDIMSQVLASLNPSTLRRALYLCLRFPSPTRASKDPVRGSADFPRTQLLSAENNDALLTSTVGLVELHILQSPALLFLHYESISARNPNNIQIQSSSLPSPQNTRQIIRHGPKSENTARSFCPEDHP